ncbi:MAG: 3'(2'),5'-bisphosphate nucleotidase CysQ [Micromonosporaceae bacterium]
MIVDDHRLAHDLAAGAGQLLLDLRDRTGFGDQGALRAAGDRLSHQYITAALADARPDDAVLSEEGADDPARLGADRVWIVDPLDGTREFGEAARTDWAVHVALWTVLARGGTEPTGATPDPDRPEPPAGALAQRNKGRLAAGAVALPAQGRTFSTASPYTPPPGGGDARRHGASRLKLVVSRTRPPEFVRRLAGRIGADLVPLGSAGAKIMAVVTGAVDAYIHAGGQYEWDSAAPVAVAQAAGLHASRIDGSTLEYNQPDPSLPDILVCPSRLAGMLLEAIRDAYTADGPVAAR